MTTDTPNPDPKDQSKGLPEGSTDANPASQGSTENVAVLGDTKKPPQELVPEPELNYQYYGNPTADSIIDTFKSKKVPPAKAQELLAEAITAEDASKVNKQELVKLLGADAAELTLLRLESALAKNKLSREKTVAAVHSTVGGKENWEKIVAFAKGNQDAAFQERFNVLKDMLGEGDVKATLAAKELKALYESDKNNSSLGVKIMDGDKAASTIKDSDSLTRAQYVELAEAALKQNNIAEYQRLQKIRAASREAERRAWQGSQ